MRSRLTVAKLGLTGFGIVLVCWFYLHMTRHFQTEAKMLRVAYYNRIKQHEPALLATLNTKTAAESGGLEEEIAHTLSGSGLRFEKGWVHLSDVNGQPICTIQIPRMHPIVIAKSGILSPADSIDRIPSGWFD